MKQTQSGMILLMVLLIFAVVAILASTMISQLSVDAERSSGMAAYQQGRCNLQVSMVPDEGANLLGPNGFTNGVGPANLGLSFQIHI